ncbi:MAG: SAM-dependent methyltransferase [Fusobacteriia bacterium 4572_74]|nr:MAG: SAM-dependent methyltransferase [Fusobacteriia bacterium 4572_74]
MKESKKFLYIINYPTFEEELCMLEMRSIFNTEPKDKILISNIDFNPSYSTFIKSQLEILNEEENFEDILKKLEKDIITLDDFRLEFIKALKGDISYSERFVYLSKIGDKIVGVPDIKSPKLVLALGKYNEKWVFGIHEKNDKLWITHEKKPCSYSNSLSVRVAKSVVNIAANGDKNIKIIDPCCGVGTTIVEGLSMGYKIWGTEISEKNTNNAKRNLKFFNLEPRITHQDMHTIKENYNSSIVDIPYGLFSHITKDQQQDIIDTARRISKKMILITFEDLDHMAEKSGFKIVDRCIVIKGSFKRYILVCE